MNRLLIISICIFAGLNAILASDTLRAGQRLSSGQRITSENGQFYAIMQGDGNFVVHSTTGRALWSTNTHTATGAEGDYIILQNDGNLVVYQGVTNTFIWSLETWDQGNNCYLKINNNGVLVLYSSENNVIWASDFNRTPILYEGQKLNQGDEITSRNGLFSAKFQGDVNFVVYNSANSAIWSTGTYSTGADYITVQTDGNIVIYKGNNPVWSTQTFKQGKGCYLELEDSGRLTLRNKLRSIVWSTVPNGTPVLSAGQKLNRGEQLVSENGNFKAVMQLDGNLVVFQGAAVKWALNKVNNIGDKWMRCQFVSVQTDGNLVFYGNNWEVIWSPNKVGHDGAYLLMQNDGNLVLYNYLRKAQWSTGL